MCKIDWFSLAIDVLVLEEETVADSRDGPSQELHATIDADFFPFISRCRPVFCLPKSLVGKCQRH